MTTREYSEFISWRIDSLMSGNLEPTVEIADYYPELSPVYDANRVLPDTLDIGEDTHDREYTHTDDLTYNGNNDSLLESITDEDLEDTPEDLPQMYSAPTARTSDIDKTIEPDLLSPPTSPDQSLPGQPRTPTGPTLTIPRYAGLSLIDEHGFLDTFARRKQAAGRRLRRRGKWLKVKVSTLPTITDSSVPSLVLTSTSGRSYSLQDPVEYKE